MDFQCVFWNGRTEKHQTSTARFRLAEENGQHRPFPIPCVLFPHPLQNRVPRGECVPVARKLRADRSGAETKSFSGDQVLLPLPKKSGIALAVPDFFVSERKDLAARFARRPACGACRGGLQPGGLRPGPTEAAAETKSFCPCHKTGENTGFLPVSFFHVLHCYLVHFGSDFWFPHPSVPAAPLPSTRNAPGFALFGPNRVRFSLFRCFLAAKFSPWFLCNLPHSVYKLKPSVIPCKREVSFLA